MKRFFSMFFICSALLLASPEVFAATKRKPRTTKCPVIAARKARAYQALSALDYICFTSVRNAQLSGYGRGAVASTATTANVITTQAFNMDGIGSSVTPIFRVGSVAGQLDYSFEGQGPFTIFMYDQKSNRVVDRLVSTRGIVRSTIYLNIPGVYYLRITGPGDVIPTTGTAKPSPKWAIQLNAH